MARPLPPWFTEAWVLVLFMTPRSRKRRYVTYWTRSKYELRAAQWKQRGAKVLYGIHVTNGALRPSAHYEERRKLYGNHDSEGGSEHG